MMVITFKGLGNSLRGKTLWQIACLTLIWLVWQERNNRIFEDKGRMEEMLWDLIRFYSSLWASCTEAFKGSHLPAAFSGVYTSAQVRDIFEIELDQNNMIYITKESRENIIAERTRE
ncbi:hypothetical protein AAG906_016042 [Vitis piasezkii]